MSSLQTQPSPYDVIEAQLRLAHAIHPGHVMPGAVIAALEEAGYRIVSEDDIQNEIALAFQAGEERCAEA